MTVFKEIYLVCVYNHIMSNLHNLFLKGGKRLKHFEFTRLSNNISPLGEISEEMGDIMTHGNEDASAEKE